MTSVGHARATGTVEFTDGTSAGRDGAAGSPLGQAVLTALRAAPLLDGGPWHWRLHDGVAELWTDRIQPSGPADPLPVATCGAALQQSRIALAAAGWESTVDRLPDPRQPGLVALLRGGGPRRATSTDAQTYRAVLAGPARQPAAAFPAPPSTLYRLRDTAERSGAGLRLLAADEPDLLAALGVPATGGQASQAILFARADTAGGWLRAGEALAALTVTAAARSAAVVPDRVALAAPTARLALADLLPAGACPLVPLRVTADPLRSTALAAVCHQ